MTTDFASVSRTRQWGVWLVLGLVLLAFLPIWYTYFTWTWRDGHYQYFPVLIAAIAGLYWTRWSEAVDEATVPAKWICLVAGGSVSLLVLLSLLINSVFVGIVATTLAAVLMTYASTGVGGLVVMAPVLALFALAIPLPFNLDQTLILKMQFLASKLASLLLDGAGIMHVRQGVILITEQARYMTEEACSGIRSLFSSLAVVSVYAVISRHRLVRTAFNLVQTVFWVLLGNAIRVAVCVYLADNVSTWYASGAGHELLSMVVFGFIIAMVVCTDQLMSWFAVGALNLDWTGEGELDIAAASPQPVKLEEESTGWWKFWDRRSDMPTEANPKELRESRSFANLLRSGSSRSEKFDDVEGLFGGSSPAILFSFAIVLLLLVGLGWFATYRRVDSQPFFMYRMERLPAPDPDSLPESLAEWSRKHFEHVEREPNPFLAQDSFRWTYQKGELTATISIDCPWNDWHNLQACYSGLGWTCNPKYALPSPENDHRPDLTHSLLGMARPDGRAGLVLFTAVDRFGNNVNPNFSGNGLGRIKNSLTKQFRRIRESVVPTGETLKVRPCTTIQLFIEKGSDFEPQEEIGIEQLFFSARQTILLSDRWR